MPGGGRTGQARSARCGRCSRAAQDWCVLPLCFFPWCRRHFHCWSKLKHMCTVLLAGTDPLQSPTGAAAHGPALAALRAQLAWAGGKDLSPHPPPPQPCPGSLSTPKSCCSDAGPGSGRGVYSSPTVRWSDRRNPPHLSFFCDLASLEWSFPTEPGGGEEKTQTCSCWLCWDALVGRSIPSTGNEPAPPPLPGEGKCHKQFHSPCFFVTKPETGSLCNLASKELN